MANMISSFFSPEEGYKKAQEESQKYYMDAQGKLQPYNERGASQFPRLNQQAEALNNPAQLENQWANSYNTSPYAQHLIDQAKSAGLDAVSSMGLNGSGVLNNIQESAGNIMQSDRQNYMNDLMQKYMASIGIGQNLYGTGANAAGGQAGNAMTHGTDMASLAYNKTNAPGELFAKILGGIGNAGINYATGGVGGAAGGANSAPGYMNKAPMNGMTGY